MEIKQNFLFDYTSYIIIYAVVPLYYLMAHVGKISYYWKYQQPVSPHSQCLKLIMYKYATFYKRLIFMNGRILI